MNPVKSSNKMMGVWLCELVDRNKIQDKGAMEIPSITFFLSQSSSLHTKLVRNLYEAGNSWTENYSSNSINTNIFANFFINLGYWTLINTCAFMLAPSR